MSQEISKLSIGTVGSNALLMGDFQERADVMAQIKESAIDHLFIADHVSFHDGFGMDGLINAATLAAMNPDITVFLGVYLLALRHPVPVARQLSTLSLSAPGRIIFGVGIGGEDRHEMEVCGVDPSTRGRRTNDCLQVVRSLLSGNSCTFESEFFSIQDAIIKPAPKPQIPIMIGVMLLLVAISVDGEISQYDGILLIAGLIAFTVYTLFSANMWKYVSFGGILCEVSSRTHVA